MIFEGADRRDDDNCAGVKVCQTALDVEELLGAEVSGKACLCDDVVAELEGHPGRCHGVAAVGDVGEGAAVDKGGCVLQGLNEVGLEGILEEGCHSAFRLQIVGCDGLAVKCIGDDDPAQAGLEVADVAGQTEDCHDLGGDGDIKTVLARNTLHPAAEAVHDIAELAVVHVHGALPGDLLDIDAEGIALLDMVVEHGCEQVVGRADGMKVTGEVQVDVLHGDDLGIAAAGCAALDAEDRSQRGLAESDNTLFADLAEAVRQTYAGRGLAFARGCRCDRGHQDQLAVLLVRVVLEEVVIDLGLVVAVLLDVLLVDAQRSGDLCDLLRCGFLRDLNVRFESHLFSLRLILLVVCCHINCSTRRRFINGTGCRCGAELLLPFLKMQFYSNISPAFFELLNWY